MKYDEIEKIASALAGDDFSGAVSTLDEIISHLPSELQEDWEAVALPEDLGVEGYEIIYYDRDVEKNHGLVLVFSNGGNEFYQDIDYLRSEIRDNA